MKGKKVQLHVPYVVKHEFLGQRKKEIQAQIKAIKVAAKEILSESAHETIVEYAEFCLQQGLEVKAKLADYVDEEFSVWLAEGKAIDYDVAAHHGGQALKDYFDGAPPYKEIKNRNDIPDSFVWQTALDLRKEHNPLHVVVNDGAIYKAAVKAEGMLVYNELQQFTDSAECRSALLELEDEIVGANLERAGALLREEKDVLRGFVEVGIVNAMAGKTVRDSSIPDDNGEAMVSMVGAPDDLTFDFDNVEYYGDTELGIPFTTEVECLMNYAIFKADYFTMDDSETKGMSISDLNDHYFDVEQDLTLFVEGVLSLTLKRDKLGNENIEDDEIADSITWSTFKIEITEMKIATTSAGEA
jgi:hypothetical protein